MTTASQAEVDHASLTAAKSTASAPSPTPTTITAANDIRSCAAASH